MLKTVPNFGQIIYVSDAFGRLVSEYAAGNEPSACHTCYLGTDHLGSTRIVTNETGAVVGRHDFMPFGEEIGANQGGRDSNFFAATESQSALRDRSAMAIPRPTWTTSMRAILGQCWVGF